MMMIKGIDVLLAAVWLLLIKENLIRAKEKNLQMNEELQLYVLSFHKQVGLKRKA